MKFRLFILSLLLSLNVVAQFGSPKFTSTTVTPPPPPPPGTTNLVMTAIDPLTDFSRISGSTWNENSGSQIVSGLPSPQIYYRRFDWADCESSTVQGNYSKLWSNGSGGNGKFRQRVINAINAGQLFAFGIMQFYPEVCSSGGFNDFYVYDNFCGTYPQYVHNLMQAESVKDFNDGTSWIPNYNSTNWLNRWQALLVAINNWLDTASYTATAGPRIGQTIIFKNVIAYVDLRGYGSYGEWHSCCLGNGYDDVSTWPAGTYGTTATMKTIIDIGADSFNNFPVCIIINVLDGNRFNNTKIPPEVGIYALTKQNAFGKLGLRRDQWGDDASYYHQILELNTMTFGGVRADTAILNRYKYNYFLGEPPGYSNCSTSPVCRNGVLFGWIPNQAETLHAYNIGNGNWGGNAPTNQSSVDSIKKAWREMGSRVLITGGSMTTTLQASSSFNVTLNFQNIGLATEQRNWTTVIELRNGSNVAVFTASQNFVLKGFVPSASATPYSQNFILGAVTPGTYRLVVKIVDPLNYAQPYSLGNTGRESDGVYQLRSNITVI